MSKKGHILQVFRDFFVAPKEEQGSPINGRISGLF